MIRKRTNGRVAAIGGLTAAVALLTGLPAAKADELADLRANQELLQRRIDQLAQAAPRGGGTAGRNVYGTGPVPGRCAGRRQLPALVPDPRHRHLDPRRRLCRSDDRLLVHGGPANGALPTTTLGATGQLLTQPLDVHGQTIPGLQTPGNWSPSTSSIRAAMAFSR